MGKRAAAAGQHIARYISIRARSRSLTLSLSFSFINGWWRGREGGSAASSEPQAPFFKGGRRSEGGSGGAHGRINGCWGGGVARRSHVVKGRRERARISAAPPRASRVCVCVCVHHHHHKQRRAKGRGALNHSWALCGFACVSVWGALALFMPSLRCIFIPTRCVCACVCAARARGRKKGGARARARRRRRQNALFGGARSLSFVLRDQGAALHAQKRGRRGSKKQGGGRALGARAHHTVFFCKPPRDAVKNRACASL